MYRVRKTKGTKIISVSNGLNVYSIGDSPTNHTSTISSFFTNSGVVWCCLSSGEQFNMNDL